MDSELRDRLDDFLCNRDERKLTYNMRGDITIRSDGNRLAYVTVLFYSAINEEGICLGPFETPELLYSGIKSALNKLCDSSNVDDMLEVFLDVICENH